MSLLLYHLFCGGLVHGLLRVREGLLVRVEVARDLLVLLFVIITHIIKIVTIKSYTNNNGIYHNNN